RALVSSVLGGENALGRVLRLRNGAVSVRIVGVVEDLQQAPVENGPEPIFYLSERQAGADFPPPNFAQVLVRTQLPANALAASLREAVRDVDPGQPVPEVTTIDELLATASASRRLSTTLFSGFTLLASALCLLGIYALVAQAVAARRREIGLRMALG